MRAYILPPEQVMRALEAGGPLVDLQVDPARLAEMTVAVAEVDGRIVAYWVLWHTVHVEPLYIDPAHRHSPTVVTGLTTVLLDAVRQTGEPIVYAEIADENLPLIQSLAERFGFLRAPGTLFYLIPPRT